MKISDFIELFKLIEQLANEGDTIKDWGLIDDNGELYIITESEKEFSFILEK